MLSTNFVVMVRVQGEVSVNQIRVALDRIRARHRLLVPGFSDETGEGPSFPLSVRENCGDNDWIEVAQTELGDSFMDWSGPCARFSILQRAGSFDIVAIFHHGVCDGMSGVFVLRDLLQALGDPDGELLPLPLPPPSPILIPQAILTNRAVQRKVNITIAMLRLSALVEKIRRRLFPRKQEGPFISGGTSTSEPPLSQQFVILPVRLSLSQTTALVERCKKEQVSVHAVICAAWLRAFTGYLKKNSGVGTVSSPVNLRGRQAKPVGDTSGLFMSTVVTSVDCATDKNLRDVAREFKQKMNRASTDEDLFFGPLLFSKLFTRLSPPDIEIVAEKLFNGPVKYDFSITNLGRLAIPEQVGPLKIEAFYGPLVNSSEHERTVGVSTLAGQMTISYIFRRSNMDPVKAKELMSKAVGLLMDAAG